MFVRLLVTTLLVCFAVPFGLKGWVVLERALDRFRLAVALRRCESASTAIDGDADGPVCLTGTVVTGDETLVAPVSGTECVCYEFVEEVYSPSPVRIVRRPDRRFPVGIEVRPGSTWREAVDRTVGVRPARHWTTMRSERRAVPFRITDDAGEVLVDEREIDLSRPWRTTVHADGDEAGAVLAAPDQIRGDDQFAADEPNRPSSTSERRRFRECRLETGDEVLVCGRAARDVEPGEEHVVLRPVEGQHRLRVFERSQRSSAVGALVGATWRGALALLYVAVSVGILGAAVIVVQG